MLWKCSHHTCVTFCIQVWFSLNQGLLSRYKALFKASQQKKQFVNHNLERAEMEGGWCSGCGFLLMLVSITYLVLLSLLLYQLAQNGESLQAQVISLLTLLVEIQVYAFDC